MYRPLQIKANPNIKRFNSATPYSGLNKREFSALLDPKNCLELTNYLPIGVGKLTKRKGLEKIYDSLGTDKLLLLDQLSDGRFIFCYDTNTDVYDPVTDTLTNVKNNWTASGVFAGAVYGDYYFVSNGVEKIFRIDLALTATEIVTSPPSTVMGVLGNRLYTGFDTTITYSKVDDGTDPPFATWNVGTLATDGGEVSFRKASNINSINFLGNIVVVFADNGYWAFTVTTIDSAGVITKIDQTIADRLNEGGFASITTNEGLFYVSQAGINNMISLGQPNIPFSDQVADVSYQLGPEYFSELNFSNASMAFDDINKLIFVACRRNSPRNNFVLCYNIVTKAYSRISEWNIEKFLTTSTGPIYGGSSVATKIYECFSGYDDDGLSVSTDVYFEMKVGDFQTVKTLQQFAMQVAISDSTVLKVCFDAFDREGVFQSNIGCYCMTFEDPINDVSGYGSQGYGSAYGGNTPPFDGEGYSDGTRPTFGQFRPFLRNIQRLRCRITCSDTLPHTLNLYIADIKEKSMMRKRNNIVTC